MTFPDDLERIMLLAAIAASLRRLVTALPAC
jgi:hypothetical protein